MFQSGVLEATDQDAGVLSFVLGSRGDLDRSLVIEGGGRGRLKLVRAGHEQLVGGDHDPPARHGVLGNNYLDRDSGSSVALIPDPLFDKTASNLQEVVARGGKVILLSDAKGIARAGEQAVHVVEVGVAEATTTAGILVKNGLVGDADAAMDLITAGMQRVPASVRGEILPVMDEYAKHFSSLGIDGETALGMIVAASADGAIGMDKMGDALKELTIRSSDWSTRAVRARR